MTYVGYKMFCKSVKLLLSFQKKTFNHNFVLTYFWQKIRFYLLLKQQNKLKLIEIFILFTEAWTRVHVSISTALRIPNGRQDVYGFRLRSSYIQWSNTLPGSFHTLPNSSHTLPNSGQDIY